MARERCNGKSIKTTRWAEAEWLWLAEVSKSVGLTRSEFVRQATLTVARAAASGCVPYFVSGHAVPPQNTAINDFSTSTAQAGGGGKAVMEEPNPIRRGADHRAKPRRG